MGSRRKGTATALLCRRRITPSSHVRRWAKEIVSVKKITNFRLDSTILFNFMSYTHTHTTTKHTRIFAGMCFHTLVSDGVNARLRCVYLRISAPASPFTCSIASTTCTYNTNTHFAAFASHLMIWGNYFDSFITGSAVESERTDLVSYVFLYECRTHSTHTHTTPSTHSFSQSTSAKMIICAIFYFPFYLYSAFGCSRSLSLLTLPSVWLLATRCRCAMT